MHGHCLITDTLGFGYKYEVLKESSERQMRYLPREERAQHSVPLLHLLPRGLS